jgi:hypothetical protein
MYDVSLSYGSCGEVVGACEDMALKTYSSVVLHGKYEIVSA